jgi:hypothetical protein
MLQAAWKGGCGQDCPPHKQTDPLPNGRYGPADEAGATIESPALNAPPLVVGLLKVRLGMFRAITAALKSLLAAGTLPETERESIQHTTP